MKILTKNIYYTYESCKIQRGILQLSNFDITFLIPFIPILSAIDLLSAI